MKKVNLNIDWPLLIITWILIAIGIIMIFSSSPVSSLNTFNTSMVFIKKHLIYVILGTIAMLIGMFTPHEFYKKNNLPILAGACILLILTLIPGIGVKLGGAKRWLNLGFIQIQPVECIKFAVIVYISCALENKHAILKNFQKGILPITCVFGLPILILLFQPDLGNTVLLSSVFMCMLYLSPTKLSHLIAMAFTGLMGLATSIALNPYQKDRIMSFLNPLSDPSGKTYHITQSLIAIGSGGITGLGLGESKLKYFYLPLQYSDFIYAILCEELGLIAAVGVIFLFLLLCIRGFKIARLAPSKFGYYLSIGLTLCLTLQALLNIGAVTSVLPITGITLTFISFGGTSLICSMFFVGVLLNISKR